MRNLLLVLLTIISFTAGSNSIIENKGQIKNDSILYYSEGKEWKIYFLNDRISFVKTKIKKAEDRNHDIAESIRWDMIPRWENAVLKPSNQLLEMKNFILGNFSFKAKTYSKLTYQFKEFDLVFYETVDNGIKYDFIYHHSNSNGQKSIQFEVKGAKQISKENNQINIITELGNFPISLPLSYTDIENNGATYRKKVDVKENIQSNIIQYSFENNRNYSEVIIDPWSSFAGGTDVDQAYGTAFDTLGNVYISGYSSSTDFPTTTGVIQTTFNALYDCFVFKFNSSGQRIWSTYYGGSNNDFGNRMVVDQNNQPILTGYSYSSDLNVSLSGVFSSNFIGIFDAFILRLNQDGTFDWATFYGGSGGDFVTDMDYFNGEIVIGGFTSSMNLPLVATAWQDNLAGALDIFVAKFDTTGNRIWDTYFGGLNSEDAHCITFDPFGNVIVGGDTYSSDFPVSVGAYQDTYAAGNDMCLVKFDNNGQLVWSTFLGSSVNEDCEAIDTDEFGNIYFSGYATGNGLPITTGLFQDNHAGDRDLVIGGFSPNGNLNWLTYAGGSAWDMPKDLTVNEGGIMSIIGETYSLDFPETGNVFQTGNNGIADVVYIVSDSLGNVSLSTLYGGSSFDTGQAIAFDNLYKTSLTGYTSSADLDISTDVFQEVKSGQEDAFVKIVDSTAGVYTSIELISHMDDLSIYPNPTNGEIIIMDLIPGDYSFSIYDLNGKLISQKIINVSNQIRVLELNDKENGIYFIELSNQNKRITKKVIKI